MALSIISLLDRYPEPIQKTIDLTFSITSASGGKYRRGLPDPALNRFMAQNRYASSKLAFGKLSERRPTLASIVATDQGYPLKRDPVEMTIETVGNVKLARSRLLVEEDFDLLREAETYLAAQMPAMYAEFVDRYMQIPAILTESITSLASLLLTQLFATGQSTYIDPDTRLGFELSYLNQVPAAHRPADLTGTSTWVPANNLLTRALPLENLRDHLNAYYGDPTIAGFGTTAGTLTLPQAIAMSTTVASGMLNANDTKIKIARMKGIITDPATISDASAASLPRPSIEDCRMWLSNEITPAAQSSVAMSEFIISDAPYFVTGTDGRISPSAGQYLPADRYVFLNEGVVEGAYVPTATNDYANTMALITEEVNKAPRQERVSLDTRFLAICSDPRMLGWRKVI